MLDGWNDTTTTTKENDLMSIERLTTIISYGGFPSRPAEISKIRWAAMIKRVYKDLEILGINCGK